MDCARTVGEMVSSNTLWLGFGGEPPRPVAIERDRLDWCPRLKPSFSGSGEVAATDKAGAELPARTTDQSSSSHRQVAVLFTRACGSCFVGAGRIMEAAAGRVKDGGGETGRRWESHQLGRS